MKRWLAGSIGSTSSSSARPTLTRTGTAGASPPTTTLTGTVGASPPTTALLAAGALLLPLASPPPPLRLLPPVASSAAGFEKGTSWAACDAAETPRCARSAASPPQTSPPYKANAARLRPSRSSFTAGTQLYE